MEKELKEKFELARKLRLTALKNGYTDTVNVCEELFPELAQEDKSEGTEVNEYESLGDLFLYHYQEAEVQRYIQHLMNHLRDKVVYTFCSEGIGKNDYLKEIEMIKMFYDYLKNDYLTRQERMDDSGEIRKEDADAFEQHIKEFSLKCSEPDSTDSKTLKEIIKKLWGILDDIDTFADNCIDSKDDYTNSRMRTIISKAKKRHQIVKTDGQDLFIGDEKI